MRGLGGGYGDPQSLRQVVKQPMQIRPAHEGFVTEAAYAVTSSLNESTFLLQEAGVGLAGPGTKGGRGARGKSPVGGDVSPLLGGASPQHGGSATPQGPGGRFGQTRQGSPLQGAAFASSMEETQVLPRTGRSARDLFAALGSGGPGQVSPRTISVRDFQRGTPVVTPAAPLPFPGPGQMSPGERRRAAAVSTTISFSKASGAGDRHKEKPQLADGVTSMLPGVYGDLGELALAPMAPTSSFDTLLERLVDAPEACFARPLTTGAAVSTGRSPRNGDTSPRGGGGGKSGFSSPSRSLSPRR